MQVCLGKRHAGVLATDHPWDYAATLQASSSRGTASTFLDTIIFNSATRAPGTLTLSVSPYCVGGRAAPDASRADRMVTPPSLARRGVDPRGRRAPRAP